VILIVPDMFQKSDLCLLTDIILGHLNFSAVYIQRVQGKQRGVEGKREGRGSMDRR
jgi:hypothetical protein